MGYLTWVMRLAHTSVRQLASRLQLLVLLTVVLVVLSLVLATQAGPDVLLLANIIWFGVLALSQMPRILGGQ
jgi:hypothetical protein